MYLARPKCYLEKNKFHGFSTLVDTYVSNGLGEHIEISNKLPKCCQNDTKNLKDQNRFAIFLNGSLCLESSHGEATELKKFDGIYLYIFSNDKKNGKYPLIHRCFHKK